MVPARARRSTVVKPGHRPGRSNSNGDAKRGKSAAQAQAALALIAQAEPNAKAASDEPTTLRVSSDYGTKTLASAIYLVEPGKDFVVGDVHLVHYGSAHYWAPQQVAWDENGKFYWGYEVGEAIKKKLIKHDDVIGLWKMLLYKSHQTSDIADRIRGRLGKHTLEELLVAHFRSILDTVKTWTKANSPVGATYSDAEIDAMPVQLLLSVPQMWKAPANDKMLMAVKKAGIENVELVYEPQCAAGYFAGNMKDKLPRVLNLDDVLMVVDIGGGTGDFVSLAYKSASADGAKVHLDTVGEPEGRMCGSEFVNEQFLKHMREKAAQAGCDSLEALFQEMGLTTAYGISKAMDQFEEYKCQFSVVGADPEYVSLRGKAGAKRPTWEVQVGSDEMVNFFKPVIKDIFACIRNQMRPETRAMIIPGGLGRSKYLLDMIQAKYDDIHIFGPVLDVLSAYQPVARGALYRYTVIRERGLPSIASFGTGQIEAWDPKLHPFANDPPGPPNDDGMHIEPNWDIVERDPYDERVINVHGCWLPMLKKGEAKGPGVTNTSEYWLQYYVEEDETELYQQIYYTEGDIQPHEHILVKGRGPLDDDAVLRNDVEPYGDPYVFKPDLKKHEYELVDIDGVPAYEIYYRIKLECNGANVKATFQLAKAGCELYDGDKFDPTHAELGDEHFHEIVAASRNPIPRTAAE